MEPLDTTHATPPNDALRINELERQLNEAQGELRCALAGLDAVHKALFCGAQLRLQMLAEIERLEREKARMG